MAISHQLDESKFSFSRFARPTQRRNKTPPPPSMHGLLVDLEHQRHRSRHRTAEGLLAGKRGWKTRSIRGPVARSGCLQPREACVRDRSGRRRRRRIRGSSREEDKFTSQPRQSTNRATTRQEISQGESPPLPFITILSLSSNLSLGSVAANQTRTSSITSLVVLKVTLDEIEVSWILIYIYTKRKEREIRSHEETKSYSSRKLKYDIPSASRTGHRLINPFPFPSPLSTPFQFPLFRSVWRALRASLRGWKDARSKNTRLDTGGGGYPLLPSSLAAGSILPG